MCAGQVPESSGEGRLSSGVCWCRFGRKCRKVPESSGVCYCRFRRQVPESAGVRWCSTGSRVRKVPESYGVACCFATLSGAGM